MIHIYCGEGKGKTTAAMGLALRCAGRGHRVVVAQFLKNGASGECLALERFENVTRFAANPFNKFSRRLTDAERAVTAEAVRGCFREAVEAARGARLLVLDETMAAINGGFLDEEELLRFLDGRPEDLEVVMTGRDPTERLLARADYITEMNKLRHPFDRGIAAREGIEL